MVISKFLYLYWYMLKQLAFIALTIIVCTNQLHAQPFVQILGVAQDGGYPHIGCRKSCCAMAWNNDSAKRFVVSFAVVDPVAKQWWLFEATPDIKEQLQLFYTLTGGLYNYLPSGIFITHAHIGHYAGLMQLGREALGAKDIAVYALPGMQRFLADNGPWSQLVALNNISIKKLAFNTVCGLSRDVKIIPFKVPHRDEFSETAGFKIITPGKKYLFIPDIDKWSKWEKDIVTEVQQTDVALLDATFYDSKELPGRRMEEVPHPYVQETMQLFHDADTDTKAKIYFIHMNHTNGLLWNKQVQLQLVNDGYNYAQQGMKL